MKVLNYVIELFHVYQTEMMALSAAQDVSKKKKTKSVQQLFTSQKSDKLRQTCVATFPL